MVLVLPNFCCGGRKYDFCIQKIDILMPSYSSEEGKNDFFGGVVIVVLFLTARLFSHSPVIFSVPFSTLIDTIYWYNCIYINLV